MPGADNLKEEVGALGAEGEIADFVDDQKIRRLIIIEFLNRERSTSAAVRRLIISMAVVKRVLTPRWVAAKAMDFARKLFPTPVFPMNRTSFFWGYKGHIHQVEDLGFLFLPGDVEVKVELIDGWFFKEP